MLERRIKIAAQILDILAKHKCSTAEISAILKIVSSKISNSAILHEADYLKELTEDYRSVPPHLLR